MDLDKVDRLEAALRACLLVESTAEEGTAAEVLRAAMRLFAGPLVAHVYAHERTRWAMRRAMAAHCRSALRMAHARLIELLEPSQHVDAPD